MTRAVLVGLGDPVPGVGHVYEHDSMAVFAGHPCKGATLRGLGAASLGIQVL